MGWGRYLRLGAVVLVLGSYGCRTGGTPEEDVLRTSPQDQTKAAAVPPPAAVAPAVHEEAVSQAPVQPLPAVMTGFDLHGPLSCLPLPAERRCIVRLDPLVAACRAAKGQLEHCEDCSYLCSRAVK